MSTPIDELTIEIDAKANDANNAIDNLCKKIDILTTSISKVDVGKLNSLGSGIKRLGDSLQTMKSIDTRSINSVVNKINSLSAIDTSKFATVSANLHQMANGIQSLGAVSANVASVGELASNISKLGNKSVQTAVTNIPQLATALNGLMTTLSNAPRVSQNVIQMTNALANLTAQGSKVGSASNSIVNGLNRASNSATKANKSFKGFASTFGKFYANCFLVIRGVKALWESINSTADYLEAFNYFEVALNKVGGDWANDWEKYSEELGVTSAEEYANSFKTRLNESLKGLSGVQISVDVNGETGLLTDTGLKNLGLNIQEVTQYASQLASVTNSVGQTGEVTLATASAFTKLGADMSSLFNVDYSSVMNNLQSGLIGQSRALYKYGIDITNATLQTYAYGLGVEKAVSEMTQAEKMQLRMIAILDQSKVAWGDQANTINSLSNSIRQFKNNIKEAGQILGQLFVPIMSKLMPIVNGVTIAIKRLMVSIAGIMGVKLDLSEFGQGTSNITDDMDGLGDSLDGVAESAKKAKAGVRGFDELNVINSASDSGSNVSGSAVGGGLDLTDEILKATSEYEKAWQEAYDRMQNKAEAFADKIEKSLEPIKKIFQDFAVGDFFQAGKDVSNLVVSITDFFARAIDNVDWYGIGRKIGDFLAGIEWLDVLSSVGNLIWQGINAGIELWKGSFDAAPIETTILTALALLKFTGAGKTIWNLIKSSLLSTLYNAGKTIFIPELAVSILSFNLATPMFDVIGSEILDRISSIIDDLLPDWAFNMLSKIGAGIVVGAAAGSWFPGAGTVAGAIIGGIAGAISEIGLSEVINAISDNFFDFDQTKKVFEKAKENFKMAFSDDTPWIDIGLNILSGIGYGITAGLSFLTEPISDLFDWIVGGICKIFGIHSPAEETKPIGKNIILGIKSGMSEAKKEIQKFVSKLPEEFLNWLGDMKEKFSSKGADIISGIKDGAESGWKEIKVFFENIPKKISEAIGSLFSVGKNAISSFVDGLKSIKIPTPHFDTEGTVNIAGIDTGIPKFNVKWYETGGFIPKSYSLIGAGENGIPEILGSVGGKPAIAGGVEITGISDTIRATSNEEIALLRQQNSLLQAILEKEFGISQNDIGKAAQGYARSYYKRTGREAYSF